MRWRTDLALSRGACAECLTGVDPPTGFTDPGGWRQVIVMSPTPDQVVIALVSRSSDLRLCSSGPAGSSVACSPAGGFDSRFLGTGVFWPQPNLLVLLGGAAPATAASCTRDRCTVRSAPANESV